MKTPTDYGAGQLAEDAQTLAGATAEMAGEKVVQARKRLSDFMDKGRELLEGLQDKTVLGAKATDKAIRDYPYYSLAVAAGLGLIVGLLMARRRD